MVTETKLKTVIFAIYNNGKIFNFLCFYTKGKVTYYRCKFHKSKKNRYNRLKLLRVTRKIL
jgi:hypothetical protein